MFVAPSKQNPKDILIDKNHFMDSLTYNKHILDSGSCAWIFTYDVCLVKALIFECFIVVYFKKLSVSYPKDYCMKLYYSLTLTAPHRDFLILLHQTILLKLSRKHLGSHYSTSTLGHKWVCCNWIMWSLLSSQGHPRLVKALASMYSKVYNRDIDGMSEVDMSVLYMYTCHST